MKSLKLVVLSISLICTLGIGNAMAADSATITVNATVLGTCSFNANTYTMDFASIDPTNTGDITGSVELDFTCTNGTNWNLTDESGIKSMDSSDDTLAYNIATYALTGTGDGTPKTLTITGTVAEGEYATASAGTYSDTFTIGINL